MTFREARACVLDAVGGSGLTMGPETVPLAAAPGRILAQAVRADRDLPPLARSIRDGYAVRAADLPGTLEVTGEVRAGGLPTRSVEPGTAIEIMTGAPVPEGADAVVMVEHTSRDGTRVHCGRPAEPGQFINPRGAEARAGDVLLHPGVPISFSQIALLATVGQGEVAVYRKPRAAILATGDEIVEWREQPAPHQIRNSNALSLACQAARAGGEPEILPVARDDHAATRALVERGLSSKVLLISGGVSAGKYDLVESVLAACGAEIYFDRVLIQPGQPLVFGRARDTFIFGLPGNPASTMVTFEIFARAALELIGGRAESLLPLLETRLSEPFRHKPGLTRFLPARLAPDGSSITPIPWQGSSDVPAIARANAFLVADADRPAYEAGDRIQALVI